MCLYFLFLIYCYNPHVDEYIQEHRVEATSMEVMATLTALTIHLHTQTMQDVTGTSGQEVES